jgi:transposase-like protein
MPGEEQTEEINNGTILEEIRSEEEADKAIQIATQKKAELKIKEQEKEIRKIKCKCGRSLKVNPKEFMKEDKSKAKRYTCDKCQLQTKVQVTYRGKPGEVEPDIKINRLGKAWANLPPSKLSDDQIKEWIANETENIKKGKSRFPKKEDQIQIRALDLALNQK